MKKVRITHSYCYLELANGQTVIVDMWFLLGIPFTFDELPASVQELEDVKLDADTGRRYTMAEIYRWSDYLIAEECHPILFDLTEMIENYEEVPE
jgi:hypothetical protein